MASSEPEAVGSSSDPARVGEWALVLAAIGIPHQVADGRVLVDPADAAAARAALEAFERERPLATPPRPAGVAHGWTWIGVIVALLLVVAYVLARPGEPRFRAGTGGARALGGEPWRAVTALTLHNDPAHLAGNVAAALVFVTAVGWEIGPGGTAALVVVAGAVGNLLSAWLRGAPYSTAGASTAIFGAIGILGGLQFVRRRGARRAWLPLAGSLGLLAMLGAGERADLTAHLLGLMAGLGLGLLVGSVLVQPPPRAAQWVLGAAAASIVAGSWWLALG